VTKPWHFRFPNLAPAMSRAPSLICRRFSVRVSRETLSWLFRFPNLAPDMARQGGGR
jgi:hypothetical protein